KTWYKPHTCVHKVKCCVWDCVPEQKFITEKVCTMQKVEKVVHQKFIVQELIEEVRKEDVILVTLEPYRGRPAAPKCGAPGAAPGAAPAAAPGAAPAAGAAYEE